MIKTSKEFMEWLGLKVGDRVKMPFGMDEAVCKLNGNYQLCFEDVDNYLTLENLLNKEFEILPAPKRVGDLKCKDFECSSCPIRALINCNKADNQNQSLFDNLAEWTNKYTSFDQEIYDLLMARLDKEVKQDERLD